MVLKDFGLGRFRILDFDGFKGFGLGRFFWIWILFGFSDRIGLFADIMIFKGAHECCAFVFVC